MLLTVRCRILSCFCAVIIIYYNNSICFHELTADNVILSLWKCLLFLTEIEAKLTCDGNTLKACLTRDSGLGVTSSQLSPPCMEAEKQSNDDGFCYVVNMAACQSIDSQGVSQWQHGKNLYILLYIVVGRALSV